VAGLTPAACRLDATGRREQAARYRRLSASVAAVTRRGDALDVTFAAGVDLSLLEEAVDVERACCPFFDLRLDGRARTLRVAVSAPHERPALDALAVAMHPEGDANG
jgi:hypothetical protein